MVLHSHLKILGIFILSIIFIAMWMVACQPVPASEIPQPEKVQIGSLRIVTQVPFVFEPHIAVDPTDPEHLAAIVISVSAFEYTAADTSKLVLYTSRDGGISWREQVPFERAFFSGDGVVGFGPDGTLFAVGLTDNGSIMSVRTNAEDTMTLSNTSAVTSLQGNDKPWLTVDLATGTLFVSYTGPTSYQYTEDAILLAKSTDGGQNWTKPVIVSQTIPMSDISAGQVVPPFGAQVMPGEETSLAVAWIWSPIPDESPTGLWVSTSQDSGQTFSAPNQIAKAWNIISTTFHEGDYYIFYKEGTEQQQKLMLAVSRDGGVTWSTSTVSGDIPLYFDLDKAPGVDVAPDGTIDVMFYAPGEEAPQCIDINAYRKRREQVWIDQCTYNIYYTFSRDDGHTFYEPIKLNTHPIIGARFVRTLGSSRPGEYMGMASTNEYAYPIWIDTQGEEGTQAYTVQIKR